MFKLSVATFFKVSPYLIDAIKFLFEITEVDIRVKTDKLTADEDTFQGVNNDEDAHKSTDKRSSSREAG